MRFEDAAGAGVAAEVVAGVLRPIGRGTWRHGEVVANLVFALKSWARQNPGWSVATADPGTRLATDPDTLRGADVGVVPVGRRPTGTGAAGWLVGAPEVVGEVASGSDTPSELTQKALEYLAAGARLVWVVDPGAEQALVFRPGNVVELVPRGGALDGGDVLVGFRCDLPELFG